MNRTLILAVVAGIAAGFIALYLFYRSTPNPSWLVKYAKPTGQYGDHAEFKNVLDPAPNTEVNIFLVELAKKCGIGRWTLDYKYMTDVDDTALLIVPALSKKQEYCLRSAGRPPYLSIERNTQ